MTGHSLLDLLQIADSSFPSGSYAHSFGLEGLYAAGDVDLEGHLRFVLAHGLARAELPVVRAAFSSVDHTGLVELDELMDVLMPVREFRLAWRSVGGVFSERRYVYARERWLRPASSTTRLSSAPSFRIGSSLWRMAC